jgi:hypothetical protein
MHSYLPSVIRLLKCTADRRMNFTYNSNEGDRRQEEKFEGILVFVLLISCLQYVVVTVPKEHVTNLLFFFRSRSYPVPHRGERVKQRKVHVRNLNQNYSTEKYTFGLYLVSIAFIRICSNVAFKRFSLFLKCALTPVSFRVFFATLSNHNFAPLSFTDDILSYICYRYVSARPQSHT